MSGLVFGLLAPRLSAPGRLLPTGAVLLGPVAGMDGKIDAVRHWFLLIAECGLTKIRPSLRRSKCWGRSIDIRWDIHVPMLYRDSPNDGRMICPCKASN